MKNIGTEIINEIVFKRKYLCGRRKICSAQVEFISGKKEWLNISTFINIIRFINGEKSFDYVIGCQRDI